MLRHVFHTILVFLVAVGVFWPGLRYDFVWDDHGLIVNNEAVRSESAWYTAFGRNFWRIGRDVEDPTRSFYRPVISASYSIDYALWELSPRGYHATNLLVHALAAVAVYLLAVQLFGQALPALLCAVLFAVHPVRIENVVWISGRTDLFCGLFYFLSAWAYLRIAEGRWKNLLVAGAVLSFAYLFSLFGKEMALSFPVLVTAHYLIMRPRSLSWRGFFTILAALVLVTLAYLGLRVAVLGQVVGAPAFGSPAERLLSIPMVLVKYVGLLSGLIPVNPHHCEGFASGHVAGMQVAYLVATGVMVAVTLVLYCTRRRLLCFFAVWFGLTLLPVLRLGTFGDVLYADRFLYVPSVGLILACVYVLYIVLWRRLPLVAMKAGLLIVYTGCVCCLILLTRVNMAYWRNNVALFGRMVRTSPDSAYAYYNYGNALRSAGDGERAIAAYLRSTELNAGYHEAFTNLGIMLTEFGRLDEAVTCFQRAFALNDRSPVAFNGLANAYRQAGELERAMSFYRQSLTVRPTPEAHNNLAECYMVAGDRDLAEHHLLASLALNPQPAVHVNLGRLFLKQEEYERSRHHLDRAEKASDELSDAQKLALQVNLARLGLKTRNPKAASRSAQRALELLRTGRTPQPSTNDVAWLRQVAEETLSVEAMP